MFEIETKSGYTLFAFEKPDDIDDLILTLLIKKKELRNNFPCVIMLWSSTYDVIHLSEEDKIKLAKEKLNLFMKKLKPPETTFGFSVTVPKQD